jgi:hypothetical protein
MGLSFGSAYTFLQKVDRLHHGPEWTYKPINFDGMDGNGRPLSHEYDIWLQDPVECIEEILSNPTLNGSIAYGPEHVYMDKAGKNRIFDEMWTGDWWWKIQVSK